MPKTRRTTQKEVKEPPIQTEVKEIEVSQTGATGKGRGRGSCGRGSCGDGSHEDGSREDESHGNGRGSHGRGSRGSGSRGSGSRGSGSRGSERERGVESCESSIPITIIDEDEKNAIQILSDDDFDATSTNSKEVVFTLIPPDDHRIERGAQNIHEDDYEKSHQSRQQDNITSLLQVTDSDSDDSDCDDNNNYNNNYGQQTNYKTQKISKKRRIAGINEDNGDNEDMVSPRRIGKPEALSDKTNVFEVCQWLVLERPDILATANQIRDAMNGSLDSSTASVTSKPPAAPNSAIEDKGLGRLWHEEIKCLFLRCREPPERAIESLIAKIFNYELYSNEATEVICHSK
ncbi:unnamed protein product [Rhizophagus irregularis]|nr:unnamed protein product [Rhizophagus irregularis]